MRLGRNGKQKEPQSFADMLEAEAKRQGVKLPKDVLKRARDLPPMKIVDDPEELEKCDFVVCMPNGEGEYFDDDVRDFCADCGRGIHYRPHNPKRPPKICLECAAKRAEADKEASDNEARTTAAAKADALHIDGARR